MCVCVWTAGNHVRRDRPLGICFISPTFGKSLSGLGEKMRWEWGSARLVHVWMDVWLNSVQTCDVPH